MRAFGIVASVFLGLALLIGAAAPQEASADFCGVWSEGGFVCVHLAATHPSNPGTSTFSLPWSGVHSTGGNCTLGAVGPAHTLQGSYIANLSGGGTATGRLNMGWSDQAAGPGCFPTFNQNNISGFFGSGGGYSHDLNTATTVFATWAFSFISSSAEDLEEAVKNLPPDTREGPRP